MADDVTITVHVRDLTGPGFTSVNRNINQLQRNANGTVVTLRGLGGQLDNVASAAQNAGNNLGGGMGLRGKAIGAAAALGTTLLPTLGALAPMLTGLTVVAGGGALALDDLKKKAKELKKPFEEWQKVANKAVAPHTEKAVKSLKGAMEDLNPVIKIGADTFGRITEKAARFVDSPAFQSSFAKNAQMGSKWVEEFAGSIGDFTQAFLDFGTKSKPALDAWDNLLGGFLDRGLPSMFQEMERGIGGSSDILNGLAYVINDSVLPALGKIAGSFTEAFGPLVKELLIGAGNGIKLFGELFVGAMKALEPAAHVAADVFRGLNEIFKIGASVAGSLTQALGGALLGSLASFAGQGDKVDGMRGSFTRFSDWVKENQSTIRLAFTAMGMAMIDMVNMGIQSVPLLIGAFRGLADMVLGSMDMMISGLASAFGDVPIIGEKLREADAEFDKLAGGFREKLGGMQDAASEFADVAGEKLGRAKVVLNVDQARANLEYIKEQLKDPALTEEREARLKVDKEQAERNLADAKRRLADFDGRKATGKILGDPSQYNNALGAVNRARVKDKTGKVRANTSFFNAAVAAINGAVVGNAYINVHYNYTPAKRSDGRTFMGASGRLASGGLVRGYADGGEIQHFPNGGYIQGPGGPRSDSILATFASGATAAVSDSEYVVQSSAVKKYGLPLLEALNEGTLKIAHLARGGVTKSEREARNAARGDLTFTHFGKMVGYRSTELVTDLARPDTIHDLVSSLNQWRNVIKKTTHGVQESRLLKQLSSAGKSLLNYEKKLTKVTTSLDKARDKLDSLKDAAAQLKDSVKSGIVSGANITKAAGAEDSRVTINTILSQMTGSAANAKEFDTALKRLKARGLDKGLISEIAQAGVDGGGLETAQAVLGADSAHIKQLNSLRGSIIRSADSTGKTAADAMYGAGIRAAEGLVRGLQSQQKVIEAQMLKIAKSMEKSIKRALGIRSPSKVMEQVGDFTAQGFAVGMRRNRSVAPAWASMLNEPRRGVRPAQGGAVAGGGAGRPIVLNVSLGTKEFGQIWVDVGRQEVSTRGGVKATLGRLE